MRKGRGFTLIELLVVISIIALLMAMLMPALARVQKQAMAVACMANLKQFSVAVKMYSQENDDYLWEFSNWKDQWKPYYQDEKLLFCPAATKTYDEGGRGAYAAWALDGHVGSYGPNFYTPHVDLGSTSANSTARELLWMTSNQKNPDRIPLLGDCGIDGALCEPTNSPPDYENQYFESGDGGGADEIWRFCINRHEGGINMLFLDWSVRKIGLKELWKLDWGKPWRQTPPPTPVWPNWMVKFKDYE